MNHYGLRKKNKWTLSSLFKIFLFLFVLLLPIGTGLSGIIGNISLLNYFSVLIILLGAASCARKGTITFPYYTFPTIIYGFYTIVSIVWTPVYRVNWYVSTNFVNVMMIVVLSAYRFDEEDYLALDKTIAASQLIVLAAVLANIGSIYKYRLSIKIVSTIGINDFACGLCLLVALWMGLASGKNRFRRTWAYIFLLLDLVIIFLAGSRGALIMFFAMVLVWILFGNFSKGTKALTVIFIALAVLFITTSFFQYLPDTIRRRLTFQTVQQTHGSGRFNVWRLALRTYLEASPLRKLFGFGFNSFIDVVQYGNFGGRRNLMAHNFIIQTMIEGGAVGLVLLFLMVCSQLRMAWKRKDTFMKIALIGLFVAALSIDMQVTRVWGFILALNLMRNRIQRPEFYQQFLG